MKSQRRIIEQDNEDFDDAGVSVRSTFELTLSVSKLNATLISLDHVETLQGAEPI